jgi:hypothetical protein
VPRFSPKDIDRAAEFLIEHFNLDGFVKRKK